MKALATLESKGIKLGDIVQYQDKGYYRVHAISADKVHVMLKGVLGHNLTKTPNSTKVLHPCWCRLVTKEELLTQLAESIELVNSLFADRVEVDDDN